jgi:hypothetical protein
MAVNNLLDTNTVSLSDIIGNGKLYKVPVYQRDYSWKIDQWEDLWDDILSILPPAETVHYMGSIVLQNKGDKRYTIIDGQQRLATLSLIVLATIKNIQALINNGIEVAENQERITILSRKFLGDKDPSSLTYSAKLELNENNNGFYQSHLMVFRPPLNERTLRDSDKLLWQAFNFFDTKIRAHFQKNNAGEVLADFLNRVVAERLMFIQVVVQDEVSAYTVFETLNSRGADLTVTDLLKNYFFSLATSTDLVHVKEKWARTVDTIGLDTFPTFLRHYWMSKNKLIRQDYLFREIKSTVRTSPQVIDLLDELDANAQLYNALGSYADAFWSNDREQRKRIKEIELFREKQALPLLMAAYNSLENDTFTAVLRIVVVITFRYTIVAGLNPNQKEQRYSQAAQKISRREIKTPAQVAKELATIYPNDRDFKNDFSTLPVSTKRNRKLARYILFGLENQLSQRDLDFEDDPATIEHILPENANDDWNGSFTPSMQENYVYRLGNYTLLEADKNRECGTRSFTDKKAIYAESQYTMTRQIMAEDWTPYTLDSRQTRLADAAKSVWRLPYFD